MGLDVRTDSDADSRRTCNYNLMYQFRCGPLAAVARTKINLNGYFPYFLGTISNRWTNASSKEYLKRFGIGIGEWRVLASVHSFGSASANEVAGQMSMDAGAVSRAVAKLLRQGYLATVQGKFSGRTKPLELTPSGTTLYDRIRRLALAREQILLGVLSPAERETLLKLMRKVHARIDRL